MSTDENAPVSENDAGDNLEEIKGIGPDSARALNEVGIYRFADFLQYDTPEQLQLALDDAGKKIPLWKIKKSDWLGQAKAKVLAQEAQIEHPLPPEEREDAQEPQPPSSREKWEQYAGFNLYFEFRTDEHGQQEWRTLVFKSLDPDSFNDKDELDIEPAEWANWILEQAKLPVIVKPLPAETEPAAPPVLVAEGPVEIEILDVHVTELPPSSAFPEKRLKAEVRFQLSGTKAEELTTERTLFRVEFHTIDLESGASNLITSGRGQLQPQMFEYTNHQEFPLPEIGRYELRSLVLLLPPAEVMASHRGPTIKIVP